MARKPALARRKKPAQKKKKPSRRTARRFSPDYLGDSLDELIWIIDGKGKTVYCNSGFSAFFAIEPGTYYGKPVSALLRKTSGFFADPDQWRLPDESNEITLRVHHPTVTHLLFRVRPYVDARQKAIGRVCTLSDVSHRVHADDHVSQSYRDLEKKKFEFEQRRSELEKAYRQIEEMRKSAEESNRLKSQFLSNMSHELRTPLNSILALSSILLARMDGDLTEEQEKQVKIIEKSGKNLLNLINDILDISKIEAGRMDLIVSEYDVEEFLSTIEITVRQLVRDAELELVIENDPGLPLHSTDENKLKQILLNLLSNAIKFTPKGRVTLFVRKTKFDDVLEFTVQDTGIGIEAKHFETIFDPFRQIDGTTTRKYGGTGLGLALTKKLVELLGGRIWVESEVGKGSSFSFQLPAKRVGYGVQKTTPTRTELKHVEGHEVFTNRELDAAKESILVIDDDPEAALAAKTALQSNRTQVVCVRDGVEGLRLAEQVKPAVIVLDIMLPEKDGWEILQRLKNQDSTRTIPVAIVSMIDNRKLGFSLGASDYMVKPVPREMLAKRIAKLVEEKGLRKILVVDDDMSQAELVEEILESDDFLSEVATSGDMAIQMTSKKRFDLVILDLMMPQTDGFAVLKNIRSSQELSETPVLILTGKLLTREDQQKLSGPHCYIFQKTMFSRENLLKEIHRILHPSDR